MAEIVRGPKGTSYVRWGRTTCEGDAVLVYKGIVLLFIQTSITRGFRTHKGKGEGEGSGSV